LGLGVVTIVTTSAVYLVFTLAAFSGSMTASALIGTVFGLSRAAPVLMTSRVAAPERLRRLHSRLAGAAPWAHRLTVAGLFGAALGSV
jgi:sulfite exporter TauE/SafE